MRGKKHIPNEKTAKFVKDHAALGIRKEDIAKLLEVSADVIDKHYLQQFQQGVCGANANVAKALYEQAMSGNVSAQIFWLKTRARWSEYDKCKVELSGQSRVVYSWIGEEEYVKKKRAAAGRTGDTVQA